jgi:cytochrome c553
MSPVAKMLSERQMEDVAAYYAAQEAPFGPQPEVPPAQLQLGGALSAVGNAEQGIPACVNCHGAAGTGMGPSWPYLAGQYAEYTALQLRLWQQGIRNNDPLNIMEMIAKLMSEEQVAAVSRYFESVRLPVPAAQAIVDPP